MPIYLLGLATSGHGTVYVSQSLSVVYHSPALLYVRNLIDTRIYVVNVLTIMSEATSYAS